jgi:hypothetical protein
MPPDGRPAPHRRIRQRQDNDEDLDRAIMAGSPFAMPMPQANAPVRSAMALGDLLRAFTALVMVFAVVAGIGIVILG